MHTKRIFPGLMLAVALVVPDEAFGQQVAPAEGEGVVLELLPQEQPVASYVDFRQELGLDLDFLAELGQRIEAARQSPDPVALASASKDLAVAEQVAGKKAKVTSAQLSQVAAELAVLRGMPEELRTVSLLLQDASLVQKLEKEAKLAEQRSQEAAAAEKRGERPKGIRGNLTVKNYTAQAATIYYNGYRLGTMPPFSVWRKYIGDYSLNPYFVIRAYGSAGSYKRKVEYGSGQNYTFVIRSRRSPGRIRTIID